jgi:hypothetical protein
MASFNRQEAFREGRGNSWWRGSVDGTSRLPPLQKLSLPLRKSCGPSVPGPPVATLHARCVRHPATTFV